MRKIVIFFFLVVFLGCGNSFDESEDSLLVKAKYALDTKSYDDAILFYLKLNELNPENKRYKMGLADSYLGKSGFELIPFLLGVERFLDQSPLSKDPPLKLALKGLTPYKEKFKQHQKDLYQALKIYELIYLNFDMRKSLDVNDYFKAGMAYLFYAFAIFYNFFSSYKNIELPDLDFYLILTYLKTRNLDEKLGFVHLSDLSKLKTFEDFEKMIEALEEMGEIDAFNDFLIDSGQYHKLKEFLINNKEKFLNPYREFIMSLLISIHSFNLSYKKIQELAHKAEIAFFHFWGKEKEKIVISEGPILNLENQRILYCENRKYWNKLFDILIPKGLPHFEQEIANSFEEHYQCKS